MLAGFSLTRGDIVMRHGQTYVVWVHGQGEVIAYPMRDELIDVAGQVTLAHRNLFKVGRISDADMEELRAASDMTHDARWARNYSGGWGSPNGGSGSSSADAAACYWGGPRLTDEWDDYATA